MLFQHQIIKNDKKKLYIHFDDDKISQTEKAPLSVQIISGYQKDFLLKRVCVRRVRFDFGWQEAYANELLNLWYGSGSVLASEVCSVWEVWYFKRFIQHFDLIRCYLLSKWRLSRKEWLCFRCAVQCVCVCVWWCNSAIYSCTREASALQESKERGVLFCIIINRKLFIYLFTQYDHMHMCCNCVMRPIWDLVDVHHVI